MKELFQMLNDPRFHLLYGVTQRFSTGPEPQLVRLNREGFKLVEGVTKKTLVHPRMRLAVHPSPLKGDAFSPIFGRISEINERSIFVEAVEPNEEQRLAAEAVEKDKVDLLALPERGAELGKILKGLGLNTRSLGQDCKTLIINGLNPDPGVTWAEPMLLTHLDNLKAGLEVLRRLSPAEKILLAVPKEMRLHYHDIEVAHVPSQYPASVNALVVKAVTGKENPEGVGIVGLHNVWSLGRVARTGLPLIETVLTIGSFEHSGNYIVKEGSTIGELLHFANIELKNGDTLVRGGPLRGESLDRLDRSVTKGSTGVFVVEAGTIPPMQGHSPCINCGACVLICPARLSPSFLSRYAEFALHERNRAEHIECCLECGLCGYVCIARRPVLQYIRLSKHKLAQADAAAKLQELRPVPAEGAAAPEAATAAKQGGE
ncbi:electron transporter RnfC [Desulfovibrio porci]|uniref:electron transporter RnfC n=1 Tax=Desulfovibrio porci TaxID=2605782 RepID=UPI002A83D462|nr:electron transporter RnfC [Desulfovibrio porci]MDY3808741.1 electron transporter RnfC [Desulfovibrio porci]